MAGREAEAKAGGTVRGETMAKAQAALPALESNLSTIVNQVDEIKKMPGAKDIGGPLAAAGGYLTKTLGIATETGDIVNRVEQLKGGAMKLAYDSLRGTGSVATTEGNNAIAAYLRASTATSAKEFMAAMDDFVSNYKKHIEVTKKLAQGNTPVLQDSTTGLSINEAAELARLKAKHGR